MTNIKIQKHYQDESRFNGVYYRDKLPQKIKDGAYVINLDGYADIRTHWIGLYVLDNDVVYFGNFGVEHIPKEIKKFIGNKSKKTNIFRIKTAKSIMCGYFCTGFIYLQTRL